MLQMLMYMIQKVPPAPKYPSMHTEKASLILEIIIYRGTLVLRHTLLLPIHLGNLSTRRRHIRLLIISRLQVSRESQTDTLLTLRIHVFFQASLVSRA